MTDERGDERGQVAGAPDSGAPREETPLAEALRSGVAPTEPPLADAETVPAGPPPNRWPMPPWSFVHVVLIPIAAFALAFGTRDFLDDTHLLPPPADGIVGPVRITLPDGKSVYGSGDTRTPNDAIRRLLTTTLAWSIAFLLIRLTILRRRRASWADIGFRRASVSRAPWIALAIMAVLTALFVGLARYMKAGGAILPLDPVFVTFQPLLFTAGGTALVVFALLVMAPLAEETFFRGLLYGRLRASLGPRVSALVSAILFAAIHQRNWFGFAGIFAIGLFQAWIMERSGSLYPTIATHAAKNAMALVAGLAT
jgi:membrane protease YdiL (CAAX protease family)